MTAQPEQTPKWVGRTILNRIPTIFIPRPLRTAILPEAQRIATGVLDAVVMASILALNAKLNALFTRINSTTKATPKSPSTIAFSDVQIALRKVPKANEEWDRAREEWERAKADSIAKADNAGEADKTDGGGDATPYRQPLARIMHYFSTIWRSILWQRRSKKSDRSLNVVRIAEGGFNFIYFVSGTPGTELSYILRVPHYEMEAKDEISPLLIRNEVGWLRYMAKNHGQTIPVPAVYCYDDGSSGSQPFIAEQYIYGESLDQAWRNYDEAEKEEVAHQMAELLVNLGEVRLPSIGTMDPETLAPGPFMEFTNRDAGRGKMFKPECYDIGPYKTAREYVLATYDRDIYYYTHLAPEDIALHKEWGSFDEESLEHFVPRLKAAKAKFETNESWSCDEPFSVSHGDFQLRNIMVRGPKILALLDWEWAVSRPLHRCSEMDPLDFHIGDGPKGYDFDATNKEDLKWCPRVDELSREIAKTRGWPEQELNAWLGKCKYIPELQATNYAYQPHTL